MSLAIDSRYITGIYALGQWFKVKKGTVYIDAFEFTDWEEEFDGEPDYWNTRHTDYQLGSLYPDSEKREAGRHRYRPDSQGYYAEPSGCHGISFIDADSGKRVSFSLMEVRAFQEDRP